ncbi:2-hydroxychromene-2-carboxylate isomerase [uncultured Ferrovibrio sp.]|jgi:2-hydroxychromene-2-carboxylate isomerase|uniref:2-hydroxychromene-2-carboxylate isomerase n=1 Tax=uncultured Ferrovibrio sp. TaxID=1576913 RepID=UPI002615A002|nr:2-hydroxychromene-2-carboxylate isomerase [uncultured Ferrovibrio sp.]
MSAAIIFYWDFTSPYAYLGANLIEAVAKKHGREVDWRPISLGHLWKAIPDRTPFPKIKMDYMMRDWERSAQLADLPIVKLPTPFPTDAKLPRLLFYRLKAQDPAKAVAFAKAVFRQYWGEGRDIAAPEHLTAILKELGIPEEEIAAAAEDKEARQKVIDATSEAVEIKAFGVPTFMIDGEMFWGSDRIDHIDRWLARRA